MKRWNLVKRRHDRAVALAIVLSIGIFGLWHIVASRAATPFVAAEPESGTISGASVISDASASNSKAVRFVASSSDTAKPGYQLTFSDEFNGTSLDTSRWNTCYYHYNSQYNGCAHSSELQWYTASQVSVQNGYARLTAAKKQVTGYGSSGAQTFNYVSGMITTGKYRYATPTNTPFTQTYGYFEARMKIPSGKGYWPAFWLLPIDYSWPPEIDVMEILGDSTNTTHMTYHWLNSSDTHQQSGGTYVGGDFASGWHTYAVDWEPGRIDWYIDGTLRRTYTSAAITDKPMYMLINLAVGGSWPGSPDGNTVFPGYADIDYVRAYKKL